MSETDRPEPAAPGLHHLPGEGAARLVVLAPGAAALGWARRLAEAAGMPALVLAGPGPDAAEILAAALAEADDRPRLLVGLGAAVPAALRAGAAVGAAASLAFAPAAEAPMADLDFAAPTLLAFDPRAEEQARLAGALAGRPGLLPVPLHHAGEALAEALLEAGALPRAIAALLEGDAARAAMTLRVGRLAAPGLRAALAARLDASGHARFAEGVRARARRPAPESWPEEAEARALQRLGRPAEAIAPLTAWLQRKPRDVVARRRLVACHLALRQSPRALAALRIARAHATLPLAVEARVARDLLRLRHPDQAIAVAEAAAEAAADPAEGALLLGETLLRAGRDAAAAEAFARALALRPEDLRARCGVAVAAEPGAPTDPPGPALAALLAALAAEAAPSRDWLALLELGEGRRGSVAAASAAAQAVPGPAVLARAARVLEAAGEDPVAEALWRRLTVVAPHDPEAWLGLAQALFRQKRAAEAAAVAAEGSALLPGEATLALRAAELLLAATDIVGAERAARRVLALDPRREAAHLLLADALWRQGRQRDALRAAQAALEALPGSLGIALRLANLLLLQGALAEAAATFRALTARPKALPMVWLGLTDALWRAGEVEQATAAAREALAAHPHHVELRARLGQLLLASGDAEAARAALAEVSAEDPASETVHLALADALWRQGRRQEALAAAREAAAAAPGKPGVTARLGHLLLENGQVEEAVAAFESAIAAQPDLVAAWTGLCDAERTRKRIKPALEAYRRAEALGMDRGTRRLLRFRLFGEMEE